MGDDAEYYDDDQRYQDEDEDGEECGYVLNPSEEDDDFEDGFEDDEDLEDDFEEDDLEEDDLEEDDLEVDEEDEFDDDDDGDDEDLGEFAYCESFDCDWAPPEVRLAYYTKLAVTVVTYLLVNYESLLRSFSNEELSQLVRFLSAMSMTRSTIWSVSICRVDNDIRFDLLEARSCHYRLLRVDGVVVVEAVAETPTFAGWSFPLQAASTAAAHAIADTIPCAVDAEIVNEVRPPYGFALRTWSPDDLVDDAESGDLAYNTKEHVVLVNDEGGFWTASGYAVPCNGFEVCIRCGSQWKTSGEDLAHFVADTVPLCPSCRSK